MIIDSVRNKSPHITNGHLKSTLQTQRRNEQLETRVIVDRNKKKALLVDVPYFQVVEYVKNRLKQKQYPSLYKHYKTM